MEEDPTDGYGDPSSNARTMAGTVDFFSTLGTERKKKQQQPDKPDPDKVRVPRFHWMVLPLSTVLTLALPLAVHLAHGAQHRAQRGPER